MNEATKQAVLSAIRSILITIGSILAARGYVDEQTANTIIGAVMVIIPVAWGIWDKIHSEQKTAAREATAVNVGIVVADSTKGKTPLTTPAEAASLITNMAPSVAANSPKDAP